MTVSAVCTCSPPRRRVTSKACPSDVAGALDGLVRFPPGSGIGLQSIRDIAPGAGSRARGRHLLVRRRDRRRGPDHSGPHGLRIHPGVMPGWDNTPRRGAAAYVFHGGNPVSFRRWLSRASAAASAAPGDPLVFVNAWNEWAEGAHLEPDSGSGERTSRSSGRSSALLRSPRLRDMTAEDQRPLLRVVRGEPTAEELAALVAVSVRGPRRGGRGEPPRDVRHGTTRHGSSAGRCTSDLAAGGRPRCRASP